MNDIASNARLVGQKASARRTETADPKDFVRKQRNCEMTKTARERAEEQFSSIQRQAKRAQTDHEIELQERAEHIARLRALRLAKEANERGRAGNASSANAAAEGKKSTS